MCEHEWRMCILYSMWERCDIIEGFGRSSSDLSFLNTYMCVEIPHMTLPLCPALTHLKGQREWASASEKPVLDSLSKFCIRFQVLNSGCEDVRLPLYHSWCLKPLPGCQGNRKHNTVTD